MTTEITTSGYDDTHFDGLPPYWFAKDKRKKRPDEPLPPEAMQITPEGRKTLEKLIPDTKLHGLVAQVSFSAREGRPTLLLTNGQTMQFVMDKKTDTPKEIIYPTNVSPEAVRLSISIDRAAGLSLDPQKLVFAKDSSPQFKERFTKLWTEELQRQGIQPAAQPAQSKPAARRLAMA